MFKNLIAPVQAWLLSQGRCVGCGQMLVKGRVEKIDDASERVVCSCKRVYIKNLTTGQYRRAKLIEA